MTTALTLSTGLAPFDNVLVARLLAEALSVLDNDRPAARLHIERAFVVAQGEGANRLDNGLLADWQIARVKQFVEKNIETRLPIRDAAARVKLGPRHFSRAFKASMDQTYSDFVTRHRITRSKHMLLLTEDPIAEIALACGFADQSHLTRLFAAPLAFRRASGAANSGSRSRSGKRRYPNWDGPAPMSRWQ